MKYFSMPADFKIETIEAYSKINEKYVESKVYETYGQITLDNFCGSGRNINLLPEIGLKELEKYVYYSTLKDISFNYTLNASFIGNMEFYEKGIEKILEFLRKLYEIGVRTLTIALPTLIEIVKLSGLDFKIKASVISQITNVNKALQYKEMGIDKIVLDESINRDFAILRKIKKSFGDELELIVNTICHIDCAMRMFHYNQISQDSIKEVNEISIDYYPSRCALKTFSEPSKILKLCWIRPEDIHFYTDIGINKFKIQGRHGVLKGDPLRMVRHYFNESFDGNLMDLLTIFHPEPYGAIFVDNKKLEGFFEYFYKNQDFCKHDCSNCTYCNTYASKAINMDNSNIEIIKNSLKEKDKFRDFIKLKNKNC